MTVGAYRNGGLFLVLSVLWGVSFMAIKVGLEFMPPVLFAAVRYDVAGALMVAYAAGATDYWRPRSRADYAAVAVGSVLVIALYNAFLFVGEQGVSSGVAAILIAVNPILATGFSRLLLPDERLSVVGLVGLVLGFLGVGLVARPDALAFPPADLLFPGFVVLAATSVALGSVLVQRLDGDISSEGMVAWSNALGALVLHAISVGLPTESVGQIEVTTEALVAVAYLAVFASAVGYLIYFRLLDRLGAIEINLVSYAVPPFAALSGWLVLGETLSPLTIAGFLVISAGFALVKREPLGRELATLRAGSGR